MNAPDATSPPLVSVVTVNYNCKNWLDRFFSSLRGQTIFDRSEFIMVDNTSTDGSAEACQKEMASWPNGVYVPTGGNCGFGGGCNRGAAVARGKYLFFLNPDLWLEPDCLEKLVASAEADGGVPTPIVLDYDSDKIQVQGAPGFDVFGCLFPSDKGKQPSQPFTAAAFFFVRRDLFIKVGQFDAEFFMFNEEMDLSWRIWLSGEHINKTSARIHHQGASSVKNRTTETKRFYANRNHLLTLLKDARCLLLIFALNQLALIAVEAAVGSILARRFSFARWSLLKPLADCWRLRHHIILERRRICGFRQRGDWWIMRRFFRLGVGRWMDVKRLLQSGITIDKART